MILKEVWHKSFPHHGTAVEIFKNPSIKEIKLLQQDDTNVFKFVTNFFGAEEVNGKGLYEIESGDFYIWPGVIDHFTVIKEINPRFDINDFICFDFTGTPYGKGQINFTISNQATNEMIYSEMSSTLRADEKFVTFFKRMFNDIIYVS